MNVYKERERVRKRERKREREREREKEKERERKNIHRRACVSKSELQSIYLSLSLSNIPPARASQNCIVSTHGLGAWTGLQYVTLAHNQLQSCGTKAGLSVCVYCRIALLVYENDANECAHKVYDTACPCCFLFPRPLAHVSTPRLELKQS